MVAICVGPDLGPDATTHALRVRTPRAVTWPPAQGAIAASNGLMLDPSGGLWVPQMSQWRTQQSFSGTPQVVVGTSGSGWVGGGTGNQYEAGPFTWNAITNPSGIADAAVMAEVDWTFHASVPVSVNGGAWMELWGSYDFAADTDRQVTFQPLTSSYPAYATEWHRAIKRTEVFTLAAGTSITPSIRLLFKSVSIGAGVPAPTLVSYTCHLKTLGWLMNPAAIV